MPERLLARIQSADQRTKRRVVVWASAVVLFLVVVAWLGYFNTLLTVKPPTTVATERVRDGFSFWQTFKSGLAVVGSKVREAIGSVVETVGAPRSEVITP